MSGGKKQFSEISKISLEMSNLNQDVAIYEITARYDI